MAAAAARMAAKWEKNKILREKEQAATASAKK
jgi:hypothetical protein